MLVFRRRGKVVGGVHHVYTTDEAKAKGVRWLTDWRDCEQGDWIRTDDGWVCQVLGINKYLDRRRTNVHGKGKPIYTKFLTLPFGRTTNWAKKFELREIIQGQGGLSNKSKAARFAESFRGRLFVMYYCASILSTGKIDYIVLGRIVRQGSRTDLNAKIFLRSPIIKKKIEETMSKMLKDKGITHESVLEDYKVIKEKALKDGKYKEALEVLSKFEKWTGLDTLIGNGEQDNGMGKLPPASQQSEERQLMERFNQIAGDGESDDDNDAPMNTEDRVRISNRHGANGPIVTDEDGQPVYEVGRGD